MAAFVSDSFTDTNDTELTLHTGEVGASWIRHTNAGLSDFRFTAANRVRPNASLIYASEYYANTSPPSADYYVEAVLRCVSNPGSGYVGVIGRGQTATDNRYAALYNQASGQWELYNTWASMLGSYTQSLTPGNDYTLRLDMVGTTIRVLIDGVERVNVTNSAQTSGKAGLIGDGVWTNSTGIHVDSFTADVSGGGGGGGATRNRVMFFF